MTHSGTSDDYKSLIIHNTPLIDLRAPIEYAKGAFPNSINLPLMNDEERHAVGICYKEKGNSEAVKLGHSLVGGAVKQKRVDAWVDFIQHNSGAMIYCFRGGQRSQIAQVWIENAGRDIVRIEGGYKAFRQYLINEIENASSWMKPTILGGRTGSGKTILLQQFKKMIDLEKIANHTGSAFGHRVSEQPTQIDFENTLAYELIRKEHQGYTDIIFEDEGHNIGKRYLPESFAKHLAKAPLIILERDLSSRIDIIFESYVVEAQKIHKVINSSNFIERWSQNIYSSIHRIERRIGGKRYKHLLNLYTTAINEQIKTNSTDLHKEWIKYLLVEYYDPMYDYQIEKRASQVIYRGEEEDILDYLSTFQRIQNKL